jgi:hypothetical protein
VVKTFNPKVAGSIPARPIKERPGNRGLPWWRPTKRIIEGQQTGQQAPPNGRLRSPRDGAKLDCYREGWGWSCRGQRASLSARPTGFGRPSFSLFMGGVSPRSSRPSRAPIRSSERASRVPVVWSTMPGRRPRAANLPLEEALQSSGVRRPRVSATRAGGCDPEA